MFLYSFSSLSWMASNFYFFEYSTFCLFGVFWGVYKCSCILPCQCWKWHVDSETVPSTILSPKLLWILVISNEFLFLCKERFLPAQVKGHWQGTN